VGVRYLHSDTLAPPRALLSTVHSGPARPPVPSLAGAQCTRVGCCWRRVGCTAG